MANLFDIPVRTLKGKDTTLAEHRGKVMLIVNTASQCGFTPQYAGLEELWRQYKDQGLVILGFPCNQFGGQEPGTSEEIAQFCQVNYGVSFPLYEKIEVNGDGAHPLFTKLKDDAPGLLGSKGIKWNFTKFLVDKNGDVLKRYAPNDKPEDLKNEIMKRLG